MDDENDLPTSNGEWLNKGGLIMDYLEYKGYRGSVEYSKADNCLVGKVLGLSGNLIAYEGNTIDELRADFEAGIDSYLRRSRRCAPS